MYQTDLTETEWQYITKVLNLQERKRKYDLRLIWNAIFYLVKTGCQWRMLPLDFPKWQLVYYYYRKWASQLDFDLLLEKLRGHVRVKRGQSMEPSVGIMDSQSVRCGNNASLNGIDGNKKVKGIKRHVIVDKNGFLIAVMVTIANVHDSKAAYLLMRVLKEMCSSVKNILADGGYRGELVGNHSIFRHDNFIGCFSADKIKMPARKYFCFNIPVYKNMVEESSCRSPYHEEYIRTGASGNPEGLCH